jgi:adenine phosphoribosyltransferase
MYEIRNRLRHTFTWRGDRTDKSRYADVTEWWRSPELLRELGPSLARLFEEDKPTVVLGPQSRGCLLGPLVALELGVGFVEVRKEETPSGDSDLWVRRTTPPDYRDRHLTLGFRKSLIGAGERVLLVDDWIDTGAQAYAAYQLVNDAEATWLGAAVVVDALANNQDRRLLGVRSLLHIRDL